MNDYEQRSAAINGKVAIITGGAGEGIGHGITNSLINAGWNVVVVDRDESQLSKLRQSALSQSHRIESVAIDITVPDAPQRAVECALGAFGRIDGLVNSAGVGLSKGIAEVTDEEFDSLFNIDFRAAFRFSRAVIPHLLSAGGCIINIGSIHAERTLPGFGIYGSVKAALEAFSRGVAIDYGSRGIRANCVHPGLVMSPQNRSLIAGFAFDPDAWINSFTRTKQLLDAQVTAAQVGDLVAWLMSPQAAAITGQSVVIDGGSSAMLFGRE